MAFSQVKSQKLIATLERNAQHNWEIFANEECKKVVEIMLDLNVPNDTDERNLYWATRIVHLSHLLLIQQIWVLAGKPNRLTGTYKHWQEFAKVVVKEMRGDSAHLKPMPYNQACADYWKNMQIFEEDQNFVKWLMRISRR
jgi:hypothetical protein